MGRAPLLPLPLLLLPLLLLSAAASTPTPPPPPPPGSTVPCVLLNASNAAMPGVCYPMMGLGTRGAGYELGQVEECWRYPRCCTKDYCPMVNATRDWLKMGGWRIDTGYPFGDSGGSETNGHPGWMTNGSNATCGGRAPGDVGAWCQSDDGGCQAGLHCVNNHCVKNQQLRGASSASGGPAVGTEGHFCNPEGTRLGIEASGVPRKDIFITIKSGSSGPMQEVDKGDRQGTNELVWLGIEYADLYLMHEGDLGDSGHHPSPFCNYPTTPECRRRVHQSCIDWMHKGKVRACGVANWEVEWLEELLASNTTLPSVVQIKYHLHQSLSTPRIAAIKGFCDRHGILFNGYSPLGRADWTTFEPPMQPKLMQEPLVLDIAKRMGKSPAQILLRWNVQVRSPAAVAHPRFEWVVLRSDVLSLLLLVVVAQQGIPTQARSMDPAHMEENLDVFSWALSDNVMHALSHMPQCNITRGKPFMEGDPESHSHTNMIGPTLHC